MRMYEKIYANPNCIITNKAAFKYFCNNINLFEDIIFGSSVEQFLLNNIRQSEICFIYLKNISIDCAIELIRIAPTGIHLFLRKGHALNVINNLKFQLELVKQRPNLFSLISNQHEQASLEFIKSNPNMISSIHNPTNQMKLIAKLNNI